MIHVCFSLYDKTGAYSKFTGTAMLSLFENTKSEVTIHLLHDNTLTEDSREKFIQIAEHYGQRLKFYNVEELCADRLIKINKYFSNINDPRFSVAMFYRLFIPYLLLPQAVERAIYLDSDIIVNLDIDELWQIELGDKPFGAVPNLFQMKDEQASNERTIRVIRSVRRGFIKPENYFNSGVLLMNLKALRDEEETILAGIKFRGEHPELVYYDQEILNYCFSTSYLKLPVKFNRYVTLARPENEWTIEKKLYHYAGKFSLGTNYTGKFSLGSDMSDPFNRLWMNYFIKTPWFDANKVVTLLDANPPVQRNVAVSVIIPLYNAEEYIGECLEGLLAQTFQDFEIIIVDDCSTDSSCKIVENYMPKFDGRLKLYHTPKNTGSGVIARNIGLGYARGEYVYNMDNDDMLTKTALEEMYNLAKEYDADVVYCERYYMSEGIGEDFIKNIRLAERKTQNPPYVKKPTLESEDLSERVQKIGASRFYVAPWLKLVRHDLLDKHKIFFPVLKISDDDIWTYALVFFAKKFLRVPNVVYIRRMRDDSLSEAKRNPQETIQFWLNPILLGLKTLDNFMDQIEFFKENPDQRYTVLEKFSRWKFGCVYENAKLLTKADFYKTIKDEFGKYLGDYDVLISYLFACMFEQNKNLFTGWLRLKQTKYIQENKKLLAEKDAEIRRLQAALAFQSSLLPQANYAISVVIPLYNAAEFVGECLDSLLIQTFQNFEVIVVDDCSTDNSVEVVESYLPKFNGRLRLEKTEKNSGGGGYVPRNIGFKLAKGKYVYFVDADDFLLGSALETFYAAAEKYEVDIVYSATIYYLKRPNDVSLWKDDKNEEAISKVIEDKDLDKFLQGLSSEGVFTYPWLYFVRRDFLLQNNITFPEILKAGDYLWDVSICCHAKKIFRLVTPLYFYRHYNINSVSNVGANSTSSEWVFAFMDFVKALSELAGKTKILIDNPNYVHGIANRYLKVILRRMNEARKLSANQEFYETLYYDFMGNPSGLITPFFFSTIDNQQKDLNASKEIFSKFKPYFTVRIDAKFASKVAGGDFQILSVSDNNASINKPTWLQNKGIGYMLNSWNGNLTFVAKATVDGQIDLQLKSLDIRDPKDKSKHIPYWIDYTKLIVNDKTIFNTLTPVWHDKPYRYRMEAIADEEVTVQLEWQPHRSDNINKSKAVKPKSKISTPPPKIKASIPRNFNPLITARIDAKFVSSTGDFQMISISDNRASLSKPSWFQRDGIGYVIQSSNGDLTFIAKATADGKINLNLRGMDVRNPDDWANGIAKRIPCWIDYTKFTINGKAIFDTLTPVWHDKPYNYNLEVKVDEEIKIQVEWQPHNDT